MGLCEKTKCMFESDGENETKLENTLQDIIQENFTNLARPIFKSRKYREHHKDIPQEEQPKTHNPHIHQGWNEGKNAKGRQKGQVTHKGKTIRLIADHSAETLQARREWGPVFNILKRIFNPEFHIQPN